MNQYTQAHKRRHAAPEGAKPVDWERLTEEYFGEVQVLRARLEQIAAMCDDNAAPTCDAHMALKFIRQVATQKMSR